MSDTEANTPEEEQAINTDQKIETVEAKDAKDYFTVVFAQIKANVAEHILGGAGDLATKKLNEAQSWIEKHLAEKEVSDVQ